MNDDNSFINTRGVLAPVRDLPEFKNGSLTIKVGAGGSYDSFIFYVAGEHLGSVESKDSESVWTRHINGDDQLTSPAAKKVAAELRTIYK